MAYFDDETEIAVIGCILDESSLMSKAVEIFGNEDVFYKSANKNLWREMKRLFDEDKPVDALSVGREISDKPEIYNHFGGVVGLYDYIEKVEKLAGVPENFEYHCEILLENWGWRKFQQSVTKTFNYLKNEQPDEALKVYQDAIPNRPSTVETEIWPAITDAIDKIMERHAKKVAGEEVEEPKQPTGIGILNRQSSGSPGQVMTIGGEPGSGKTALVQQICLERLKQGYKGVILPTEMSSQDLANRFVAHIARVPISRILDNDLDAKQRKRIIEIQQSQQYQKIVGWIQDVSRPRIEQIKAILRSKASYDGLDFAVIDHLQACNFQVKYQTKTDSIGDFLYEMLSLANELKIHVIITSQLSREGRKAVGSPKSWMFRDSSAIEDISTLAILLKGSGVVPYLENYSEYGDEDLEGLEEWAEIISCYVVKDRHNSTPTIPLCFNKKILRFSEVTDREDWENWEAKVGYKGDA